MLAIDPESGAVLTSLDLGAAVKQPKGLVLSTDGTDLLVFGEPVQVPALLSSGFLSARFSFSKLLYGRCGSRSPTW